MQLKKLVFVSFLFICALSLLHSSASAQSIPTDLAGTEWIGGDDDEVLIRFYDENKVTVRDAQVGRWVGTYKFKGSKVTAEFSGFSRYGTDHKKNMKFSGEFYKSGSGFIAMRVKFKPDVDGTDSKDGMVFIEP